MKKFTLLKNLFKQNAYKLNLTREELNDFKLLDAYIEGFFPKQDKIAKRLAKVKETDLQNLLSQRFSENDSCNLFNLPFHTRDNNWLARFLYFYTRDNSCFNGFFKYQGQNSCAGVSKKSIKKYIELSPKFDAKRCEYEQNVVKAYLTNWAQDHCASDFFCKQDRKLEMIKNPTFDYRLRQETTLAMRLLGIPYKSIEAGIEGCRDFWLDGAMNIAFGNEFLQTFGYAYHPQKATKRQQEYNATWKALRMYEYGQTHQDSIKRLGEMPESMKIADNKVQALYAKKAILKGLIIYNNYQNKTL